MDAKGRSEDVGGDDEGAACPTIWLCDSRADARTRTGDPFITSEVLYQLSYVGELPANTHLTRPDCGEARTAHTAVVLRPARGSDADSGLMRKAV